MKKVIFLNRSYNDIDGMASLMAEFSKRGYEVEVIRIVMNRYYLKKAHYENLFHLEKKYNVKFSYMHHLNNCPLFVRCLVDFSSIYYDFAHILKSKNRLFNKLGQWLDKVILPALDYKPRQYGKWLESFVNPWRDSIIVSDEIVASTNRTPIVDLVLDKLSKEGKEVYAIKTGHHTYHEANPAGADICKYKKNDVKIAFFSCSSLIDLKYDRANYGDNFPIISLGNPRMDRPWISELHREIMPLLKKKYKLPAKKGDKVRISFMLSKLNYGIDVPKLKSVIKLLNDHKGVELIIKPHTRGMLFDFMKKSEVRNAYIAYETPSSVLIDESDLILSTGSSVVFHALTIGVEVAHLSYIQKYSTVFDEGDACHVIHSEENMMNFLEIFIQRKKQQTEGDVLFDEKEMNSFIKKNVYTDLNNNGSVAETIVNKILSVQS